MSQNANRMDVAKRTSRCWMLLTMCLLMGNTVGCNLVTGIDNYVAYNTPTEDFVSGWRNNVWAKRAYNARRDMMDPGPYEREFRRGFIAGYSNVAQGGQGCTPSLPPRYYWSWRYQSAEGQVKVQAWFAGYPLGARAAEEDGVGNYYEIQIADWITDSSRECPDCLDDNIWEDPNGMDPNMMQQPGIDPGFEELPPQPTPAQPTTPMGNQTGPTGTETGMWSQPMTAPTGPQSMPEFREPSVTPATYPANLLDTVQLRIRRPGEDDAPPPPFSGKSGVDRSSNAAEGDAASAELNDMTSQAVRTVSYKEAMIQNLRVTIPSDTASRVGEVQEGMHLERFPAVSQDGHKHSEGRTPQTATYTSQLVAPRGPLMRDWEVDIPVTLSAAGTDAHPSIASWR